jgi:bifunctional pyridoxal-dependent enzyme with beta-cystathionase and maltose regulon repressor activities
MFIDISETGLDSQTFANRLKEEGKLALVPGTPRFFGPGAEGHVRMCIATSRKILTEALDRLETWLEQNFT